MRINREWIRVILFLFLTTITLVLSISTISYGVIKIINKNNNNNLEFNLKTFVDNTVESGDSTKLISTQFIEEYNEEIYNKYSNNVFEYIVNDDYISHTFTNTISLLEIDKTMNTSGVTNTININISNSIVVFLNPLNDMLFTSGGYKLNLNLTNSIVYLNNGSMSLLSSEINSTNSIIYMNEYMESLDTNQLDLTNSLISFIDIFGNSFLDGTPVWIDNDESSDIIFERGTLFQSNSFLDYVW